MRTILKKKAQLGSLKDIVITLVVLGVVLGAGFLVLEEFMDEMDDGSEAESGVNQTIQALLEVPTWLTIIVIVAVVGIILAIIFAVMPRTSSI